ncbi:aldehyde dehydrogenase family protein [Desulfosarcina sp.]|uniref:aldehyde dehydrogenase family protein n=1 Tax=Desulfosarcina sp. TaxID=2027861 RepID=UPI0039706684
MKISKYFNPQQLRGLIKAGDVILPGTDASPSFSRTGCIDHVDRMASYLTSDDLGGLRFLLGLFRFSPNWLIRLLMTACAKNSLAPGFLGSALRTIDLGIKGMVMSLYYSNLTGKEYQGKKIFAIIGWNTRLVMPHEDPPSETQQPDIAYENPEESDVARILARARQAQPEILSWGVKKRLEFITRLKAIIIARQADILDRIQADTGKSRTDALTAEIFGTLDHLDYLEKNAVKVLKDRKVPTPFALMGKQSKIYFEPVGTTLIISPWNYPFYQAIVPITLAFLVGNAIIYKPSSATPLKGLVEDLLAETGFDPAWVQVVYGPGKKLGRMLIDQRPDKIFFIGSQRAGRQIMTQAAEQLIPVELEMGGKDPMIVFEDANLDRAAAGAIWGAFTNTGQSCTSVEKLYVQGSIYDAFKAILVRETLKMTRGTDSDGGSDIGPMTTSAQVKVIAAQIEDAREKGATLLTGGDWDGASAAIPPIVVEGSSDDMLLNQEETFGPVLPIFAFHDEAEAVRRANNDDFGLSASVWSADRQRADRVARAIVTGNVSINNVMLTEGNHALPFGGSKKSGIGRYKGEFGFYCFANIKSILVDKNSGKMEANWFPYTQRKFQLFTELTTHIYSPGVWSFFKAAVSGIKLEGYVKKLGKKG